MPREIVLDTETTGLDPRSGHRIVEIACVELEDFLPTGRHFHRYINPEREMEAGAERIHGLSGAFLADKPRFAEAEVVDALIDFIGAAQVVAHNAGFDRAFVNAELDLAGRPALPEPRWTDTLAMAQKRFPGMANSLDALCKRYRFSLAEREKHGALIDAQLLARVYLELRGGREAMLDLAQTGAAGEARATIQSAYGTRARPLCPRLTSAELARHLAFVQGELKADAVWFADAGRGDA
jgi:DNA polymerase-3 subunit epsilon